MSLNCVFVVIYSQNHFNACLTEPLTQPSSTTEQVSAQKRSSGFSFLGIRNQVLFRITVLRMEGQIDIWPFNLPDCIRIWTRHPNTLTSLERKQKPQGGSRTPRQNTQKCGAYELRLWDDPGCAAGQLRQPDQGRGGRGARQVVCVGSRRKHARYNKYKEYKDRQLYKEYKEYSIRNIKTRQKGAT